MSVIHCVSQIILYVIHYVVSTKQGTCMHLYRSSYRSSCPQYYLTPRDAPRIANGTPNCSDLNLFQMLSEANFVPPGLHARRVEYLARRQDNDGAFGSGECYVGTHGETVGGYGTDCWGW